MSTKSPSHERREHFAVNDIVVPVESEPGPSASKGPTESLTVELALFSGFS